MSGHSHTPAQTQAPATQAPASQGPEVSQGNAANQQDVSLGTPSASGVSQPAARGPNGEAETVLEQWEDMLADPVTDAARVVRGAATMANNDLADVERVLASDDLRTRTFGFLNAAQTVTVMLYFQVGTGTTPRSLADAVKWVDGNGGLDSSGWARLVAAKSGIECHSVLADDAAFQIVRRLPGDPVVLFPPFGTNPFELRQAIHNCDAYWTWIADVGGVERQDALLRFLEEAEGHEEQRQRMVADGTWGSFVNNMADGPNLTDGTRLWNWFLCETQLSLQMLLFQKRFGVELTPESTQTHTVVTGDTLWGIAEHFYGDGNRWQEIYDANKGTIGDDPNSITPDMRLTIHLHHDWDWDSIQRTWVIADMLPPGDVSATSLIRREGSSGGAGGWANRWQDDDGTQHAEIGMEWGTGMMGQTETGSFTAEDDPMRGLNVFDATMRHEIGHNVGKQNAFDQENGDWVFANYGWLKHWEPTEVRMALDAILAAYALDFDGLSTADADIKRDQVLDSMEQMTAFNTQGFTDAVEQVEAGLFDQIDDQPFIEHLLHLADEGNEAWEDVEDMGGRQYHIPYSWYGFASCPVDLYARKVSNYAMRSPMEWFAEVYATFYADADQPNGQIGTLLRSRDPALEQAFRATVHDRVASPIQPTVGAPEPTT